MWNVNTIIKANEDLLPELTSKLAPGKDVYGTVQEKQFICYDKYIFHGDYLLEAVEGLLQQGTSCTEEIQKLFWKCLAAEWPETAADSSAHNYTEIILIGYHAIDFKSFC